MLQAINTGHDGSLTTVHANSPRDALARLETMVMMAGFDLPLKAIRDQVCSGLDLIVQLTRFRDGTRRVTQVTEVIGMEGDIITLQDVFVLDTRAGFDSSGRSLARIRPTGLRPRVLERLAEADVHLPPGMFSFESVA
jgi:pilus assembly protein CpaF